MSALMFCGLWNPGGDVAPILLTSPTAFRSYEALFVVLN